MPRSETEDSRARLRPNDRARLVGRATLAVALVLAAALVPLRAHADATSPPDATPLLWQIRSDSATIYLYGSIHAARPDAIPPPAVVRHAFTHSDALATEVALDDDLGRRLSEAVAERSELPPGLTLESLLDRAGWLRIRRWASDAGLPVEAIETLQPWLVEMLVAEASALPDGFTAENGLDTYFSSKATARGMPQTGLETVEEQLDALAGGSFEDQARSLLHAVEYAGEAERIELLYEAWRSGDASAIEAIVLEQYGGADSADTYARLFTRRNVAWMDRLTEHLAGEQTTFVVVGAGHLVGPDSLLDLLRDRGYAVARVRRHEQITAP